MKKTLINTFQTTIAFKTRRHIISFETSLLERLE